MCISLQRRFRKDECSVLVRFVYSGLVEGLPFVAHAALLACVGGLSFPMHVYRRWFPALASDCLRMPNDHVSL